MSIIPATRNKRLLKPEQDHIQWELTQGHSKRYCSEVFHMRQHSNHLTTTEELAYKFVQFLYNTKEADTNLAQFAKDITYMCQNVAFSSLQFNQIVSEQAVNSVRMLEYYYKLYTRLNILALSLPSILQHVENLDETLLNLISQNESVAKAYIPHLPDQLRDAFFEKDGRQLTSWTALMDSSNAQRLHLILEHYADSMPFDQLKTILIRLMSFHKILPKDADENLNICFYRQLRHVKQSLFNSTTQKQTKAYDSFLAKKPIYLLISQWFFEFNVASENSLTEFIAHIASMSSSQERGSEVMDMSVLLYSYFTGCKDLNASGGDVLRIFDIIEAVNTAVRQSLERDESNELGVVLTLTQIALEHMHTSVGYTYASWFEATFVRPSSILDKRTSAIFIKILQQMTLYELPSILQIQGKALSNCSAIPNAQEYVSAVRKRLVELGLNQHLKKYPVSIMTPLQAESITEALNIPDEVEQVLQQFAQKNNTVPKTLLQASVFQRKWFVSTFLPKLFAWQSSGHMEARNSLIMALKKINKIPDSLYKPFIQQQQQQSKRK
ncbi:hypothetical protein MAM1_0009c00979 [Mucor ambiguus]|uniref:Fanconi anaemia group A protein helical domain-containing protein n=1 Tax=Mucor ambiguus TaxID=91626 RepID=A0A0C9M0E7_9FUNG|nr:hypothetical protein MAM1_0009c00979 [Mucor ambiguus]